MGVFTRLRDFFGGHKTTAVAAGSILALVTVTGTQVGRPNGGGGSGWGWEETGDTPPALVALAGYPTPETTGVPEGTVLTDYTGPCDIYTPDLVIDSKTINCPDFRIMTTGVVITNSLINGSIRVGTQDDYEPTVISDPEGDDPIRLTIEDSEIDASASLRRTSCSDARSYGLHFRRGMSQCLYDRGLLHPRFR
jgi:hypothetical protein